MKALTLKRFLALLVTVSCLIVTLRVWKAVSAQQAMWPMPALYLLEMLVLAICATVLAFRGNIRRLLST